jgi:hypothetical protein
MTLTNREKMVITIANTIALYSQKLEEGTLPPNQSVIDFILKTIPEGSRAELSMELIDDVFSFISSSHVELS